MNPIRQPPEPMTTRVYKLWAGTSVHERVRARWVMSQATLDKLGGERVPLPACILGLPVRIDPDEPGMRLELEEHPQWATTMTAWMWP